MARAKFKEPPFVVVRWLDAWGDETAEATMANAHEAHQPVPMETAGWLLREDKLGVSVFCERCTEKAEFSYRGRTFISRGMIKEVIYVRLTKDRSRRDNTGAVETIDNASSGGSTAGGGGQSRTNPNSSTSVRTGPAKPAEPSTSGPVSQESKNHLRFATAAQLSVNRTD